MNRPIDNQDSSYSLSKYFTNNGGTLYLGETYLATSSFMNTTWQKKQITIHSKVLIYMEVSTVLHSRKN